MQENSTNFPLKVESLTFKGKKSLRFAIGDAATAGYRAGIGHRGTYLVDNPLGLGRTQHVVSCGG
jgi:hypothetical protein